MYDHAGVGARRAFPQARFGGPATTDRGEEFLQKFLEHCLKGRNFATGEIGSPLDFISFHTKGAYFSPRRTYGKPAQVQFPSLKKMIEDVKRSLEVVASFPELSQTPVFIDECDPAVGVNYGMYDNPNFGIWNTSYYPSFVAALMGQFLDLAETVGQPINLISHASYYYEARRWFESNRTLFTNENVDQPIIAGLKMLSRLGSERLALQTSDETDALAAGYTPQQAFVSGLASTSKEGDGHNAVKISLLLWHHADDRTMTGEKEVKVELKNLPFKAGKQVQVKHWRVDS